MVFQSQYKPDHMIHPVLGLYPDLQPGDCGLYSDLRDKGTHYTLMMSFLLRNMFCV